MIIDAFLYHNERAILDLRMTILADHVDQFLLVEGTRTFRGEPRAVGSVVLPIAQWVELLPESAGSPWERESRQRNAIKHAVAQCLDPDDDDVVMISDVDEIPDPHSLEAALTRARAGQIVCFQQLHSYFRLNLVDDEPWYGTRMLSWGRLKTLDPEDLRSVAAPGTSRCPDQYLIQEGGWHFGWMGGNDLIREKLRSFCHDDLDRPELTADAYLNHCVRAKKTLHNQHPLRLARPDELPPEADLPAFRGMLLDAGS